VGGGVWHPWYLRGASCDCPHLVSAPNPDPPSKIFMQFLLGLSSLGPKPLCKAKSGLRSLLDMRYRMKMSALPLKADMLGVGIDVC
jgi:hypothetical protein